jgi:3-methyladenine DNA glycosylase AlkD
MTKREVLALLQENRDARGEANWKKLGDRTGGLASFGIGLTRLRAIAKRIGRDHDLAITLWDERNHDAKILGLLIDDPKRLTRDQVEMQVDGAGPGMLSHVLSSCDATLPKSPIAFDMAKGWMASPDPVRRGCGYGLVYELAKDTKDERLTDAFFLGCADTIRKTIATEENRVRVGMGGALIGIGKRNRTLNAAASKVAKAIGPIQFGEAGQKCEPMDVLKHLTSDQLRQKLGVTSAAGK